MYAIRSYYECESIRTLDGRGDAVRQTVLSGLNLSFRQLVTTKRICTDSLDQPVVQISESYNFV